MQGTCIQSLVQKDSTCYGAAKPIRHSYCACALGSDTYHYQAHAPASAHGALEPSAPQQGKPLQWEAHAPQLESISFSPQLEKVPAQQQRPRTAKMISTLLKKRIWFQKFPFSPLSFSLYFYKEINAFTLHSFGPFTLITSYMLHRTKSDGFWCMIPLMFTLFLMVILRCNRKGRLREAFWDFF